ncbi:hypothetical protein [Paenibacillus naphthalenovorans]|uniref:hypothetical protein n=1 Tax=Paenibacillus naphthalenovorans TaxID=162209 RepID=UPI003D2AFFF6
MGLIEFILDNWFILVIIYIGLSTFMKTKRGGDEPKDQPGRPARPVPQGMPPFGGDGPGRAKRVQGRQEPKAVPAPEARAAAAPEPRQEPARAQAPRPRTAQRTPASGFPGSSVPVQSPVKASFRATSEDLARGVLWAEILGPSRAKRPYRR